MPKSLLSLLSASLLTCAQAHAGADQPPAEYVSVQSNVSYNDVLALPVYTPTQVLEYGDAPQHYGELWLPPKTTTTAQHPLVVLIHGGCWLNAFDVTHTHALSTALSQAGYAVWAPEYRRIGDPGGGWPGTYDDVLRAIQFTQSLKQYPVATQSIVLVGHSAGGHLALLAGAEVNPHLRAVIGLAAIADLPTYARGDNSCQTATPRLMGGTPEQLPELYAIANPLQQTLHPHTTLIHGDADTIVPLSQSDAAGVVREVIAGAGHFDMVHPGTTAYQSLLKALADAFAP